MTDNETRSIVDHFSRRERVGEYLTRSNPMNDARRDLIRRAVLANMSKESRVLEVGCGIGTLSAELAAEGMSCTALDISAEMVAHAKMLIGGAADVLLGDVFDYSSSMPFDAVVANGVACYYRDTSRFLRRLAELVRPGGLTAVVHRNALFELFALNEGTIDFMAEWLMADLPADARDAARAKLAAITGLAEPRHRSSSSEVFRRSENPLTISSLYDEAGIELREVKYCFIHSVPPRIAPVGNVPDVVDLQHRYEDRWEGTFLGSQFLVLARRR